MVELELQTITYVKNREALACARLTHSPRNRPHSQGTLQIYRQLNLLPLAIFLDASSPHAPLKGKIRTQKKALKHIHRATMFDMLFHLLQSLPLYHIVQSSCIY